MTTELLKYLNPLNASQTYDDLVHPLVRGGIKSVGLGDVLEPKKTVWNVGGTKINTWSSDNDALINSVGKMSAATALLVLLSKAAKKVYNRKGTELYAKDDEDVITKGKGTALKKTAAAAEKPGFLESLYYSAFPGSNPKFRDEKGAVHTKVPRSEALMKAEDGTYVKPNTTTKIIGNTIGLDTAAFLTGYKPKGVPATDKERRDFGEKERKSDFPDDHPVNDPNAKGGSFVRALGPFATAAGVAGAASGLIPLAAAMTRPKPSFSKQVARLTDSPYAIPAAGAAFVGLPLLVKMMYDKLSKGNESSNSSALKRKLRQKFLKTLEKERAEMEKFSALERSSVKDFIGKISDSHKEDTVVNNQITRPLLGLALLLAGAWGVSKFNNGLNQANAEADEFSEFEKARKEQLALRRANEGIFQPFDTKKPVFNFK